MNIHKQIIYKGKSEFGQYKIVDQIYNDRQARVLFGDDKTPQSGMALDNDPTLLFNYNQRFLEIIESIKPKSVLIIGGGAFTLPKAIIERFDNSIVDVVEIDPLLPKLANQFFGLPINDRLGIYTIDGRYYVENCKKSYDVIIIDAFSGFAIPYSLMTSEAIFAYKNILNNRGIIAVNFIAQYHVFKTTLTHNLVSTFKTQFSNVQIYPASHDVEKREEQNLLLVASDEADTNLDYLQSAPVDLLIAPENTVLYDKK